MSAVQLRLLALPKRLTGTLLFISRYFSSGQHHEASENLELKPPNSETDGAEHKQYVLARLLKTDKIVLGIAEQLHYSDIVSLGQVSKSIHDALIPGSKRSSRFEDLRVSSCEPGAKSQCWACATQICTVRASHPHVLVSYLHFPSHVKLQGSYSTRP